MPLAQDIDSEYYLLRQSIILNPSFISKHFSGGLLFSMRNDFLSVAEKARKPESKTHIVSFVMVPFANQYNKTQKHLFELLKALLSTPSPRETLPIFKNFVEGQPVRVNAKILVTADCNVLKPNSNDIDKAIDYLCDHLRFPQEFLEIGVTTNICKDTIAIEPFQNTLDDSNSHSFAFTFQVAMQLAKKIVPHDLDYYSDSHLISYSGPHFFQILADIFAYPGQLNFFRNDKYIARNATTFKEAGKFFAERLFKGENLGITKIGQILNEYGDSEQQEKCTVFKELTPGRTAQVRFNCANVFSFKLDGSLNADDSHKMIQQMIQFLDEIKVGLEEIDKVVVNKKKETYPRLHKRIHSRKNTIGPARIHKQRKQTHSNASKAIIKRFKKLMLYLS